MAGTDRIDIADIDEIAPPFDLDGAAAPAVVAPSITAESEFDIAAVAAVDNFLDVFGETVTYYPAGGSSRSIQAVIVRKEVEAMAGFSDVNNPVAIMQVANDSTRGIASFEIDRGGDEIEYSYKLGKTAQRRKITRLTEIDYAWLELEVR